MRNATIAVFIGLCLGGGVWAVAMAQGGKSDSNAPARPYSLADLTAASQARKNRPYEGTAPYGTRTTPASARPGAPGSKSDDAATPQGEAAEEVAVSTRFNRVTLLGVAASVTGLIVAAAAIALSRYRGRRTPVPVTLLSIDSVPRHATHGRMASRRPPTIPFGEPQRPRKAA